MRITDDLALAAMALAVDSGDRDLIDRVGAILDAEDAKQVRHRTPEWEALPEGHPRRTRATMVAADCWADHCDPNTVRLELAAQIDDAETELRRRVRETSWDVSAVFPWSHRSPSHAELQARRNTE